MKWIQHRLFYLRRLNFHVRGNYISWKVCLSFQALDPTHIQFQTCVRVEHVAQANNRILEWNPARIASRRLLIINFWKSDVIRLDFVSQFHRNLNSSNNSQLGCLLKYQLPSHVNRRFKCKCSAIVLCIIKCSLPDSQQQLLQDQALQVIQRWPIGN